MGHTRVVSKFEELMCGWDKTSDIPNVVKLPVFGGIVGKEVIVGYSLIDEIDYEKCSKVMWCFNKAKYVVMHLSTRNRERLGMTKDGKKNTSVLLHRYLLGLYMENPDKLIVDHINRIPFDNRRCNLRLVTTRENSFNKGCYVIKNKYKGINFNLQRQKWRTTIQIDGVQKHLGYFNTPEEAAEAYDHHAILLFGEYAYTNFEYQFKMCYKWGHTSNGMGLLTPPTFIPYY